MSKHTPGPWKYGTRLTGSESHRGFYLANDKGWTLAVVQPLDTAGIEGEANARLIAAAPDLLALLREGRNDLAIAAAHWNEDEDRTLADFHRDRVLNLIGRVDAAIARAEGKA